MNPNWNDAVPSWRQPKTAQSSDNSSPQSSRAATASGGQLQQWAHVPSSNHTSDPRRGDARATPTAASSKTGRVARRSRSAQGLATVGLGNFKIGALHDAMQAGAVEEVEQEDGFLPGGLGVPESFQGERPTLSPHGCTSLQHRTLLRWIGCKEGHNLCCACGVRNKCAVLIMLLGEKMCKFCHPWPDQAASDFVDSAY